MKPVEIVLVLLFALGMGMGQILLKFAALQIPPAVTTGNAARILSLATNWAFLIGALLYACMLVYWMWLLTFIPLSRAYPFTIASVIVAATGGALLFQEPITPSFMVGAALIGAGLFVLGKG